MDKKPKKVVYVVMAEITQADLEVMYSAENPRQHVSWLKDDLKGYGLSKVKVVKKDG